ncbi:S8 family serine peptidase [Actinoplanes sp. TRM 88003]|uniref:S8 family serine peptidase n=1 Tax=Paractinoplanes aksuensis TaxID=2939490 RepID=A0ABT1DQP9_9ACTN|nr:S8 family serine peptidase [Actinoplanes aksuensis]MCO8273179.1 S8 family serine peptidase [Actinoplanes aksuensis]
MRRYVVGAVVLSAVAFTLPVHTPMIAVSSGNPAATNDPNVTTPRAARAYGQKAPRASGQKADRHSITRNLTAAPQHLLPPVVSKALPVRVVSTTVGRGGRPVVSARTVTDRSRAERLVTDGQRAPGAVSVELDAPVSIAQADPFLPAQWDLARTRVDGAWPRSTGAGVTVAVVDSGVDASHPDLAGQVLPGADFITGTEGVSVDPHGHGTHVAGTIAALTGNGTGVAGMAPHARILPVRVLGANGSGYMSDVANGITWAVDHGADVVNMSISSSWQVAAVSNAISYARDKGVVVVAAAGNSRAAGSPVLFPAADEGVIAVAATNPDDSVAGYSNRGGYVDVAAPGTGILSTYPGDRYIRMNGTSMAAPHVAAVAALLKGGDRALTPERIETALTSSAADLGAPGRDDDFGAGLLDAAAALATLTPPAPATTAPTTAPATAPITVPATTPPTTIPATPSPTVTETTPAPAPTTEVPAPAPTPSATPSATPAKPIIRLVRPGSGKLTVAIVGVQGVPVEVQQWNGPDWVTVRTYPATTIARFVDLVPGFDHRVVVAGATSDVIRL